MVAKKVTPENNPERQSLETQKYPYSYINSSGRSGYVYYLFQTRSFS